MTNLLKTTVLSLSLLAGAGFAAHAQSDSVASLPPGSAAAPPAAIAPVAPSAALPGPAPGGGWYPSERQTQAAATPSGKYLGPSPGGGWYPATENQTQAVTPSAGYPGVRAN